MLGNKVYIIYEQGITDEAWAIIHLVNGEKRSISDIVVTRRDLGSFDEYVDAGELSKRYEVILPGEQLIIDRLSTFDLEYINSYNIRFTYHKKLCRELNFKIRKYGQYESDGELRQWEAFGFAGRIVKTTTE